MSVSEIASVFIALAVGIGGSAMGAYIGMKVGLARLQVWQLAADKTLDKHERAIVLLNDDSLMHDMEIGSIMEGSGLARLRRQRARD